MKKTIYLIVALVVTTTLSAQIRGKHESRIIAENFFSQTSNDSGKQQVKQVSSAVKMLYTPKSAADNGLYYVYGREALPGFVIVSGDTRTYDVLGYSEDNIFDTDNIPENMKAWLAFYEQEIEFLDKAPSTPFQQGITVEKSPVTADFASSVQPLLGGIKWNQDAPYNDLCPILSGATRTASGCVATAMAQVMKYHEWPAQGKGSHSYTTATNKYQLDANFGATIYDWANMTKTYNNNSTVAEKNAVATLVYHCGVAVDMDYNKSSSAYSHNIGPSMINYFDYDSNIQFWMRNFYTRAEWVNLIKTELNADRPVIYAGVSQGGGHQFVCDGYDSNDFIHINWGWGGMSDGYFRVSALDPDSHGIGGGLGGFNYSQSICTGVQKPTATSSMVSQFNMAAAMTYPTGTVDRTSTMSLRLNKVGNYGVNTMTNTQIGFAFYNQNEERMLVKSVTFGNDIKPLSSYSLDIPLAAGSLNELAAGNYQVYPVFKSDNENDWVRIRYYVGNPAHLNLVLTETEATFSFPTDSKPDLELISLATVGKLYYSKTGRFEVSIKNKGAEHHSEIAICLEDATNPDNYEFINTKVVNIAQDETVEYVFSDIVSVTPGEYNLYVKYGENNTPAATNTTFYNLGEGIPVTVYPIPEGKPNLVLQSPISFPNNNELFTEEEAELSAVITNTGVFFDEEMIAFIFPATGGGSSLTYIGKQALYIDTDETSQFTFRGSIDLEPGDYAIALYYKDATSNKWERVQPSNYSRIIFTLKEKVMVGLNSIYGNSNLKLSPVPVKDMLTIHSKANIQSVELYNMMGQMLQNQAVGFVLNTQINTSNLESGVYIIKVITAEGIESGSFIKQ